MEDKPIAAPVRQETGKQDDAQYAPGDSARPVACPFCDSTETELFALFSQFLLASQYYCRSCRSVFDRVRWDDEPARTPAEAG